MRRALDLRGVVALLGIYVVALSLFEWVSHDDATDGAHRHGRQRARARDVEVEQHALQTPAAKTSAPSAELSPPLTREEDPRARSPVETKKTPNKSTNKGTNKSTNQTAPSPATRALARPSAPAPKPEPVPVKACDASVGIAASIYDARHPERSFAMLTTQVTPQAALYRHGDWIGAHRVLAIHPRAVMLETAGETCWLRMTPRKHAAPAKKTKKAASRPKRAKR